MRFGYNKKQYKAKRTFWSREYDKLHKHFDEYFRDSRRSNFNPKSDISHLRYRYSNPYKTQMYQSAQDVHQSMFNSLMDSYMSNVATVNLTKDSQAESTNYEYISSTNSTKNLKDIDKRSKTSTNNDESKHAHHRDAKYSNEFRPLSNSAKSSFVNSDENHKNIYSKKELHIMKRGAKLYFSGRKFRNIYSNSFSNNALFYKRGFYIAKNGFQSAINELIFKNYSSHYSYHLGDLLIFLYGQLRAQELINGINDARSSEPNSHDDVTYYSYGYRTFNKLNSFMGNEIKLPLKTCVSLVIGHLTKCGVKL